MIVPSISEITTRSVESHTKIRAVHAMAPEVERENVIVLAPGLRFRAFCKIKIESISRDCDLMVKTHELVRSKPQCLGKFSSSGSLRDRSWEWNILYGPLNRGRRESRG